MLFFFFTHTATPQIYTLSLHDALPISTATLRGASPRASSSARSASAGFSASMTKVSRSEEHTSELQSPYDLVCRLLLEKKKREDKYQQHYILTLNECGRQPHVRNHNTL